MPISIFTRHSILMRSMNVYSPTAEMKTTARVDRNKMRMYLCMAVLSILLIFTGQKGFAQTGIYFNGGAPQFLSVCENSTGNDLGTLLEVTDSVPGETDTWALVSGP